MDVVHHQTLYQLNKRVNPRDNIVGWCVQLQASQDRMRSAAQSPATQVLFRLCTGWASRGRRERQRQLRLDLWH